LFIQGIHAVSYTEFKEIVLAARKNNKIWSGIVQISLRRISWKWAERKITPTWSNAIKKVATQHLSNQYDGVITIIDNG